MKKTYNEFLIEKGFDKGTEDEAYKSLEIDALTGHYNDYNAEVQKAYEEAIEAKASKEDLESMSSKMQAEQLDQMKSLNAVLVEHGIVLKKLSQIKEDDNIEEKSLLDMLKENRDSISALKDSNSSADNVKLTVKAVGDMSLAGNVTGQIPQAMRLAGTNDVPSRRVRLLDIVSTGAISSNLVEWVYKSGLEGTAGQTAEAATKNQIDFDLVVGSQKVEKTTAFITVTDEMLDDVEQMNTMINTELTKELLKAVEAQVYEGTGVTPQMNGIKTTASAFTPGSFATGGTNEVENANVVDVLGVAVNQIMLAQEDSADVNWILMHPSDVTNLKMQKVSSTDKRYIERLANIAGNLSMDGIPIIPTTLVTIDKYLIGDFTKAFVLTKQGVSIEIGLNADNFVKNFKTVRAEWRGVTFVKNNDRSAFVEGDFSTDIAAILAP
jgi:HK97 family phage major capsid protein